MRSWQLGFTVSALAREFECSERAIYALSKKRKETGGVSDLKRCGRPRKSSTKQDRKLFNMCPANPKLTSNTLKQIWEEKTGIHISTRLVRLRLNSMGLHRRVSRQKPLLTLRHVAMRKKWAEDYQNWTVNDWEQVVFSDESTFQLIQSSQKVTVWTAPNEEYKPEMISPTAKHGGGFIMVWGCMSAEGVGVLKVVDGTLNSQGYMNILENCALPACRALKGNSPFIFQHDGAPCHTAKVVTSWIRDHNVRTLPWTPQSPDMSPIEHLWHIIKLQLREKMPKNKKELVDFVKEQWYSTPQQVCKDLVHSMPKRVAELKRAKGEAIKY
jgi:transposase